MSWTAVTVARRPSGVNLPERCVYCNEQFQLRVTLRAQRRAGASKGHLTRALLDEHLEVDVPYCAAHARRSERLRRELRVARRAAGVAGALAGALVPLLLLDAPFGVRVVFAVVVGGILGLLSLLAGALLIRRLPRYRDWGAGQLGIALAAGADALTFSFTNTSYAASFRIRNPLFR